MTATMQPKLTTILISSCHHHNDEQRLLCGAGSSRDMYCTMDEGDLALILLVRCKDQKGQIIFLMELSRLLECSETATSLHGIGSLS